MTELDKLKQMFAHRLTGQANVKSVGGQASDARVTNDTTDTALVVDDWQLRHGEQLASGKRDKLLMADCHTALFEPKPQLANCHDRAKHAWFSALLESDAYQQTHSQTMLNKGLAEIAARKIADSYLIYRGANPNADDSLDSEFERLDSVDKAMTDACDEVRSVQDYLALFRSSGASLHDNRNQRISPADLAGGFQKMQRNQNLRAIFELAGRYRRYARACQKSKVKHGYDDMVGVKCGNSIPHLLTSELAKLADVDMELDLMRRLVENQAMIKEYRGEEKLGLGPVVVLIDESGSMDGAPIQHAKAIALTMAWIAQQQKRWIAFSSFTHTSRGRTLVMEPKKWDENAVLDWLMRFDNGGTELTLLLDTLPNTYWKQFNCPPGKTDIVVISDACVTAPPKLMQKFNEWKKDINAKCYSLILESDAGDLGKVSDRYWLLDQLDVQADGVADIFSI